MDESVLLVESHGGYLRRKADRFIFEDSESGNKHERSARETSQILLGSEIQISASVFSLANEHDIDIVLFDRRHRYVGRFQPENIPRRSQRQKSAILSCQRQVFL